jgi:hypothetical protein
MQRLIVCFGLDDGHEPIAATLQCRAQPAPTFKPNHQHHNDSEPERYAGRYTKP